MPALDPTTVTARTSFAYPTDEMRKVTAGSRPGIKQLTKDHKPGDILARVDVDPYERSFRNSSTHVLAARLDEASVRSALKSGHAYVAHDWMCDATGFRFEAIRKSDKRDGIMGDEAQLGDGLTLSAQFAVPCSSRLMRNGKEVSRSSGKDHLEIPVNEPGVYRLEAWLMLDDEARPWIFSNPIYVR